MERFLNVSSLYGITKKNVSDINLKDDINEKYVNNYIDDNLKKLFKKNRELQISLDNMINLYEEEKNINEQLRDENNKLLNKLRVLQFKDN